MRNRRTILGGIGAVSLVVVAAFMLTSCGRNWCVAGLGPCDMFNNMEESMKPKPYDVTNPCSWTSTGAPRGDLTVDAPGVSLPVRVGRDFNVVAYGGTPPYRPVLKNPNMGTFTALNVKAATGSADERSWKFMPTRAGVACLKILDTGMGIDTPCDNCWIPINILPALTTIAR